MLVHEDELNERVARVLNEGFGLNCRSERPRCRSSGVSIKCYYCGFRVVIEASYSSSDAESNARKRIEEGLADIAIALHYTRQYLDVERQEIDELLKNSDFDAKVLVPRDFKGLERYVASKTRAAMSKDGWFKNVKLETVVDIIRHAARYMLEEVEVWEEVEKIRQLIYDFINVASKISNSNQLRERIANILYRIYGFSVAEIRDAEVIFGQAALAVLLSTVFYERLRHIYRLPSVKSYTKSKDPIHGLRSAMESMLKISYEPALKLAIEILNEIPPALKTEVEKLVDVALRISEMRHLLARDFAGRIYHKITGDIAVRKGFATFYTEVPSAYMLTALALRVALNLDYPTELSREEAKKILERVARLKIADFACGSGTLLSASLYNASRIARVLCFFHELECPDIEKKLVEEGVYGLDALRYATQITTINLALMSPTSVTRENIVTVYLGYIPQRGVWLGSLELLENSKKVVSLSQYIEKDVLGVIGRVSVTEITGKKIEIPDSYDVIVMNPPFTRATGRVGEEYKEGKRGLFGFIADENVRRNFLRRYDELRKRVRSELISVAEELFSREHEYLKSLSCLSSIDQAKKMELDQYYSIGQAGEGLLFLYLAYRHIKPGGVIAFVLPRNLLSGISWFLARALLADKFHLKYVVVSSDFEKGYNFSEGTSLSECLVIARRVDSHSPEEVTKFINLLKKPSSALEATLLSEELIRSSGDLVELPCGTSCLVLRVSRSELLENLDNWNRLVFLPESEVVSFGLNTLKGDLSVLGIRVPVVRLMELVESMGVHSPMFHEHFSYTSAATPYPIVYGGREEVRSVMRVKPNAYATCKTDKAAEIYKKFSGRLLLPDRIWLDTTHITALFSDIPVLSNVFYAVRLKNLGVDAEKALVLWFNTTWGLLSIIANREETRGRWMRLKMAHWRLLPVLDVSRLSETTLMRLSSKFDELSSVNLRRIPEQYSENSAHVDPMRLKVDLEFLKALDLSLDEDKAKQLLFEIYRRIAIAFKRWID
ncbi:MAG: hypothetical protein QW080_02025 [Sulfolobales archaeon]